MGKYNELLTNAGILEAAEGLQPTSKGARVRFTAKDRIVKSGPFADADHDIAGFWIFNVKSLDEAIAWVKRCPFPFEGSGEAEIEIRQIFEASDFGAKFTPELREAEERIARPSSGAWYSQQYKTLSIISAQRSPSRLSNQG